MEVGWTQNATINMILIATLKVGMTHGAVNGPRQSEPQIAFLIG